MNFKNWPITHSEELPRRSPNNSFTPKGQNTWENSKNQANLENGTYEQIVTHLERELELNGLEAPDELQTNTVSHNIANTKTERPKSTCHHGKKNQDITEISAVY